MSYLAVVGGLVILVQGVLDVLNILPAPPPDFVRPYLTAAGVVSIVAGLLTIAGGGLILQRKKSLGSPIVIVGSLVGLVGGGGFIVGTVLGLVGGISNFRRGD